MSNSLQTIGRQRQAPVIGITGNIGTGKSTVANMLAAHGVHVIDADHVVHDLYTEPNSALVSAIAAEFGARVVSPQGTLDRAVLGGIVFGDAAALERLETLVHPVVVAVVEQELVRVSLQTPVAIEAIKLIESELVSVLDAVWIVEATPEIQRARLLAKGMADNEAQRRIAAQPSSKEKISHLRRKRGNSVPVLTIENAGLLAELRTSVDAAWETMQAMLRDVKEL